MKTADLLIKDKTWYKERNNEFLDYQNVQLVIGFGSVDLLKDPEIYKEIEHKFPNAEIALCSSAGEIFNDEVHDDSIALTAIEFKSTVIKTVEIDIDDYNDSYEAGVDLIKKIDKKHLRWIFILSDGNNVNGSELVKGLNSLKPDNVLISGGLAGDGYRFQKTYVGLNKLPSNNKVVAIAFYGENLILSNSSSGGWETFGLERTVSKSIGNRLYEIDGKNALELYKKYLGKYANELPGSAFLFPLSMKIEEDRDPIVRTILAINEKENYMVFAGDIPEGSKVRFMKANMDRLIDAANIAATECMSIYPQNPKLALIVSCVGRKLVLGNRISEELEAINDLFGSNTSSVGFYAYGEISPLYPFENCELHNQTITITGINEIV